MKRSCIGSDALLLLASLVLALCAAGAAAAQERPEGYPGRAIRIVVPFPAGGPTDVVARLIGMKLTEAWGQSVVVENRPGANTVIGAQIVAKAAPDGYTLLMAIDSTLAMNQFLYRTPPYDPFNDFVPVTLVARTTQLLLVNAASDIKSVGALVARAKADPGRLTYGAGTLATKLAGFLFSKAAGVATTLVPYNGSADVTQALLTRSVDFAVDGPTAAMANIEAGKFRVLAKFDPRPFPPAPDAPVITRDVPGLDEVTVWFGLVAPRGTPPAIVDTLQRQVAAALSDRAVAATAAAAGVFPATSTPAEFAAFIRREADRWSKVLPETGMRFD
jgi:tripartite-type tricarboxylate transporter receptor subunit TctC